MSETIDEAKARYAAACHAMQSGVAGVMNLDESETMPKHLRVGVNSALVSNGALAKLLMDRGIITELEHFVALADAMEEEQHLYEARLSRAYFGAETGVHLA